MSIPSITPPIPASPAPRQSSESTYLAIQYDPESASPIYFVVAAPDEKRAREIARAAVGVGHLLVDLLTAAKLSALLDRTLTHPPDYS